MPAAPQHPDLPMPGLPPPWSHTKSVEFLDSNPLTDLIWPDRDKKRRKVRPAQEHCLITYGKWLKETPYFPGLFELVHDILTLAPDDADGAWLLKKLREADRLSGEQTTLL